MRISEEFLYEVSGQLLNYKTICELFGLSEAERKNPMTGKWIVEEIRNLATHWEIRKALKTRYIENAARPRVDAEEDVTKTDITA